MRQQICNLLIAFTLNLAVVQATCPAISSPTQKLVFDRSATPPSTYGHSLAASEHYIVVGTLGFNAGGGGAAYIFNKTQDGVQPWKALMATDRSGHTFFCSSVALSNDIVVVGAMQDSDNGMDAGAVYLFDLSRPGTDFMQQLTAKDGASFDYFGRSVAADGRFIAVGSPYHRSVGAAYMFVLNEQRTSASQEAKLMADSSAIEDQFGISVAVSGSTIVVGAPSHDSGVENSGSAFVFTFNKQTGTATLLTLLKASDARLSQYFGFSVAASGRNIVVGASADNDADEAAGAIYLFKLNQQTTSVSPGSKIVSDNPGAYRYFGWSVAVANQTLVVGEYRGANGSAHVFVIDETGANVTSVTQATGGNTSRQLYFGATVAVWDDYVVVSGTGDGALPGEVYLYTTDCNNILPATSISSSSRTSSSSTTTTTELTPTATTAAATATSTITAATELTTTATPTITTATEVTTTELTTTELTTITLTSTAIPAITTVQPTTLGPSTSPATNSTASLPFTTLNTSTQQNTQTAPVSITTTAASTVTEVLTSAPPNRNSQSLAFLAGIMVGIIAVLCLTGAVVRRLYSRPKVHGAQLEPWSARTTQLGMTENPVYASTSSTAPHYAALSGAHQIYGQTRPDEPPPPPAYATLEGNHNVYSSTISNESATFV